MVNFIQYLVIYAVWNCIFKDSECKFRVRDDIFELTHRIPGKISVNFDLQHVPGKKRDVERLPIQIRLRNNSMRHTRQDVRLNRQSMCSRQTLTLTRHICKARSHLRHILSSISLPCRCSISLGNICETVASSQNTPRLR